MSKFKSWNKAFGLTPSGKVPEGRTKLTARNNDLYYVVINHSGHALIWDDINPSLEFVGFALIKQPRGYEIYQIYVHVSKLDEGKIMTALASFFPVISEIELHI